MSVSGDLQILRERLAAIETALAARPPDAIPGSMSALVKTIGGGSYPSSALAYYPVKMVTPGGTEAEGEEPTFDTYGATFYAANLGTAVPDAETYHIADMCVGRWTFRYD